MNPKHKTWTPEQKRKIVQEFATTPLTVAEFVKQGGPVAEFILGKAQAFARQEFIMRMQEKLNLTSEA